MCVRDITLSLCGAGKCVNNSCECAPGYVQSNEFLYDDLNPGEIILCDYNAKIILGVVWSTLILTLCTFVVQIYVIQNRRQFRRLIPGILGFIFSFIAMPIRLKRVNEDLFGFDFTYTFFLSSGTALLLVQYVIFLNKYLEYMLRFFNISETTRKWASITLYLQYFMAILIFLSYNLFTVTVVIETNQVKYVLIVVFAIMNSIFNLYTIVNLVVLLTKYIDDLQKIVLTAEATASTVESPEKRKFVKHCQRAIPRVRFMRAMCMLANGAAFIEAFLMLFSTSWLKRWIYFMYINYILYDIACLSIIRAASKRRKRQGVFIQNRYSKIPFGFLLVSGDKPSVRQTDEDSSATRQLSTKEADSKSKKHISI